MSGLLFVVNGGCGGGDPHQWGEDKGLPGQEQCGGMKLHDVSRA